MYLNKLALALSLATLALPMSAMADDAPAAPASNLTWNFALTTDYVFRGITQTNFRPAAQGGLDYTFGDSGWAVGTWGSNVDFGSGGPDLEIDTYISWSHALSDKWNFNIMLDRYNYVGYPSGAFRFDYNELIGKFTYDSMLTFTGVYADDYAHTGISETYFNVSGKWGIGNDFNLNAGIGRTDFSDGVPGYTDWNLGVSRQCGPANIGLNYYDTTGKYTDLLYGGGKTSDSVVLTVSFGG